MFYGELKKFILKSTLSLSWIFKSLKNNKIIYWFSQKDISDGQIFGNLLLSAPVLYYFHSLSTFLLLLGFCLLCIGQSGGHLLGKSCPLGFLLVYNMTPKYIYKEHPVTLDAVLRVCFHFLFSV